MSRTLIVAATLATFVLLENGTELLQQDSRIARVAVGGSLVDGRAEAGSVITATLFSEQGVRVGAWTGEADELGEYAIELGQDLYDPNTGEGALNLAMPDTVLEVEFRSGDPVVLRTPMLTVSSDPDLEWVAGAAPPGTDILIEASGAGSKITRTVRSQVDGNYSLDVSGVFDIEPDSLITTTIESIQGHKHYARSAPLELSIQIDEYGVDGRTSLGYPVEARLRDDESNLLGEGYFAPASMLEDWDGFTTQLFDHLGNVAYIRPGDIVEVDSGADSVSVQIPDLEGKLHVSDDTVVGRTLPNSDVRIEVTNPQTFESRFHTVKSDGMGRFSHDFSSAIQLPYNAWVWANLSLDRHTIIRRIVSPGLSLDLWSLRLEGTIEPMADVLGEVFRDGAAVHQFKARTTATGEFDLDLQAPDLQRTEYEAGDGIVVVAPAASTDPELRMMVPDLEINADPESKRVSGRAPPGSWLSVQVHPGIGYSLARSSSTSHPVVGREGVWNAEFRLQPVIKPGAISSISAILPSGHRATLRRAKPMLSAAYSGSTICGLAMPHERVSLRVTSSDRSTVTELVARADTVGRFETVLPPSAESKTPLVEGASVRATMPSGDVELVIPELATSVDLVRGEMTINSAGDSSYRVDYPARDCLHQLPDEAYEFVRQHGTRSRSSRIDGGGVEEVDLEMSHIAHGVGVSVYSEAGHRVYQRVYHPATAQIHMGSSRVLVRGAPQTTVEGELLDVDGNSVAQFGPDTLTAAGEILFELSGDTVFAKGQTLLLRSDDNEEQVPIGPLSFDFEPEAGILGIASPDSRLTLALYTDSGRVLVNGRVAPIIVESDSTGTFTFGPEDVPIRAKWSVAELSRISVSLPIPNGHSLIDEWVSSSIPGTGMVFLPALEQTRE